jgi:hypothetical protein
MADPKAVLAEHGLDVPDGMDVKVVENADNCMHITMPAAHAGHAPLTDNELTVDPSCVGCVSRPATATEVESVWN